MRTPEPPNSDFFDLDEDDGGVGSAPPKARAGQPHGMMDAPPPPRPMAMGHHGAAPGFGEDDADRDDAHLDQPVPRITIHVFCERADTRQVIHAASLDRRLAKAHVTFFDGGVANAWQAYENVASPSLIILESRSTRTELLRDLETLSKYCDEGTKVMVIGATNDIKLYRELVKLGVSEYLVAPFKTLGLIRTIAGLYADPDQPFYGKMISVIGARGGVGASTIAHNLAWTLAERIHSSTTLVDLDLSFGTTALDFNQDPNSGIADALVSPERADDSVLDRLLTRATERLGVYLAPATLDREYDLGAQNYELVLERVRRGAPFVVVDLPHIWSAWVRQTLLASDEVVLVCTPDLASLRNGKNLYDLVRNARPNDTPPRVILNMVGAPKRPEVPLKEFSDALGVAPAIVLPYDAALFGTAANNGQMLYQVQPQSRGAIAMDSLGSAIAGRAPVTKKTGMLTRILGSKRA